MHQFVRLSNQLILIYLRNKILDGIKSEYNTASNVRVPIYLGFVREVAL